MKTWEMIKELTENPKKKFVSKTSTPTTAILENGFIEFFDVLGYRFSHGTNVNIEWEEVKQPVGFMEAVKSDKRIWFPDISEKEEYLPLDVFLKEIASNYYAREIVAIITDGEFYIEGQGEHK